MNDTQEHQVDPLERLQAIENFPRLVEMVGFDTRTMVEVFASAVAKVDAELLGEDFDPANLPEIRAEVVELYRFGVNVNKIGRELQERFDKFAKLMYELEIHSPDSLPLVYTPTKREGAGRKPMSAAERIKALQKREADES